MSHGTASTSPMYPNQEPAPIRRFQVLKPSSGLDFIGSDCKTISGDIELCTLSCHFGRSCLS